MGILATMDRTGDTKTMWNKDNPDEVAAAKAQFKTLKDRGFAAFKTDKDGNKGEQITVFDPTVERIIMVPPMRGG